RTSLKRVSCLRFPEKGKVSPTEEAMGCVPVIGRQTYLINGGIRKIDRQCRTAFLMRIDVGTQDVDIASNRAIERKLDSLVFRKSGIVEFQVKSTGCGSRSQTRLVFAALFDEIDSRHPSWGPFVLPRNVPVRRIRISKIRKDLDICGGSY